MPLNPTSIHPSDMYFGYSYTSYKNAYVWHAIKNKETLRQLSTQELRLQSIIVTVESLFPCLYLEIFVFLLNNIKVHGNLFIEYWERNNLLAKEKFVCFKEVLKRRLPLRIQTVIIPVNSTITIITSFLAPIIRVLSPCRPCTSKKIHPSLALQPTLVVRRKFR